MFDGGLKVGSKFVHSKCRDNGLLPKGYPERQFVKPTEVAWPMYLMAYYPPYFVSQSVIKNDETKNEKGWADPEDVKLVAHDFKSFEGNVLFDRYGKPLNPIGRTGLAGRGALGRWGRNPAVDAALTRFNERGLVEVVLVKRRDNGLFALPGGMVNKYESCVDALGRELHEETHVLLEFMHAYDYYGGYVDDPRNTDNAWIETFCMGFHFGWQEGKLIVPRGDDDAELAGWFEITPELLTKLHASHDFIVKRVLTALHKRKVFVSEVSKLQIAQLLNFDVLLS